MRSHLTMLIGDKPSTKHYRIDEKTNLAKKGVVEVSYLHESLTIPVENIDDLYCAIDYVRSVDNSYIIRGLGQKEYDTGVRRCLWKDDACTDPNFMEVGSSWICCDFDQEEVPEDIERTSMEAVEFLIRERLPKQFSGVSYVYQWSASAGLEYSDIPVKSGTSVHLFFYLDTILTNTKLKAWFMKRHKEEGFDLSTFNTVTPIFVNTTVVKDPRIIDVIAEDRKFGLVRKDSNVVKVPSIKIQLDAPITAQQKMSIEDNTDIISVLRSTGAVYKKSGKWIKLWHRGEATKGDWFIAISNPAVVHHHSHKSMSVSKWLSTFWSVDYTLPDQVRKAHNFSALAQRIINKNQLI